MTAIRDQIVILGGTTHCNRGDRAMHEGLLRWLREVAPGSGLVFLAGNPEFTSEILGVESRLSPDATLAQSWTRATPGSTRQRLRAWWRGIRFAARPPVEFKDLMTRARAVFVPGSGSMNSLWWHDWLYVKAAEVHAARRAGARVFMTSQGIGPRFTHGLDRLVARGMFQHCTRVGVRDGGQSISLLRELGVDAKKCLHTGDDALLVEPDFNAADCILAGIPGDRMLIGLNVRDSSSYGRGYPKPAPQLWARVLEDLIGKGMNAHFLFLPVSHDRQDDDRVAAREVARHFGGGADRITLVEDELDAPVLRGLAARLQAAAGISYHFLLFCLAANVPAVGAWQNPYYRHKQEGLFRLYECPEAALELDRAEAGGLSSALLDIILRRDAISTRLAASNRKLAVTTDAARSEIRLLLETPTP